MGEGGRLGCGRGVGGVESGVKTGRGRRARAWVSCRGILSCDDVAGKLQHHPSIRLAHLNMLWLEVRLYISTESGLLVCLPRIVNAPLSTDIMIGYAL